MSNAAPSKFIVKVTNVHGDSLYIREILRWRSTVGYTLIIREKAKRFASEAAANEDIAFIQAKPFFKKYPEIQPTFTIEPA